MNASKDHSEWVTAWLRDFVAEAPEAERIRREELVDVWLNDYSLDDVVNEWWALRKDSHYLGMPEGFENVEFDNDIKNLVSLYNNTRNGLAVWKAFNQYRQAGKPIPEFMLEKFDEWSRRLADAAGAAEVAAAIDMSDSKPGAKGRAALDDYARYWRIASEVERLLKLRPHWAAAQAIRRVAEDRRQTFDAVKAIWQRWQRRKNEAHGRGRGSDLTAAMDAMVRRSVRRSGD